MSTEILNEKAIAGVELAPNPDFLVKQALERALDSTTRSNGAVRRVTNAINHRFKPYVRENWVIAEQLTDPVYGEFVDETRSYLDARVGAIICSDGRIAILAIGDPLVLNAHRRLQGVPQTRYSTRVTREPVLDDSNLAASLNTEMGYRRRHGLNPEIVEYMGPHIYSVLPEEGCGAFKGRILGEARTIELGMKFGGVPEFFNELGDRFFAFNNNAQRAGGKGTTFDLVHDAYSEGLIFGLRDQYKNFDTDKSLRANLVDLAREDKILMTESLKLYFGATAQDIAQSLVLNPRIDVKNPQNFSANAMTIGRVARVITDQQLKEGVKWMPRHFMEGLSEGALRSKVYTLIRNYVYTELARIRAGSHELLEHAEILVNIGPTSALYNREHIPFLQKTHPGDLSPEDVASSKPLYDLRGDVMKKQGIDMEEEGRLIIATGEYDEGIYKDEEAAEAELNRVASIVRNNAAQLRVMYSKAIETGEAIVLGALHAPVTRKIIATV